MVDIIIQKLLELSKDAVLGPARREHLEMAATQLQYTAQQLSDCKEKNAILDNTIEELKVRNKILEEELQTYDKGTYLLDIGPCCIKKTKNHTQLTGFYCNECGNILEYSDLNKNYVHQCIKCGIRVPAEAIERALADYLGV